MKRLNKWLPHELTANQKKKKSSFWSIVFCYSTQQQWTIAQLDCSVRRKMDIIRQQAKTSSVAGLRRGSKALPKAKLAPKKGHGHCLMVCRLSDPPQLSESRWNHYIKYALELDEMHLKLQRLQPALINRKGRILFHDNTRPPIAQQSKMNWATKFCLICHIHLTSRQLTTTSSSILTTSCRENAPTTSRIQKMLSKSSSNPEAWIFTL